jgi:diadenosine tetraphosphatase ApaH/serine/threonine PP2A family protein phosphatase
MPRHIIVGDVHGCLDELDALLSRVRFQEGSDRLVFVGDLVARGPNSLGVVRLARRLRACAVLGNHEAKLLRGRREGRAKLSGEYERLAQHLSTEEWQTLESLPLWLDVAAAQVRVVHAGVVPGRPIDETPREALLTIRAIDADGLWTSDKSAKPLWGELYTGPPHVVFGHNALEDPQRHSWATGIDTGCVYGGRLTALVLSEGEPISKASANLISVPARKRYYPR